MKTPKTTATRKRKTGASRRSGLHPTKLVRRGELKLRGLDAKTMRRIQVQNRIRSTVTGTRVFDRSLHKTNVWLKDVMTALDWDNRERAYSALRATLHSLRDVLFPEEVVQLGAQLPILLRGVYYEGWAPHHETLRLHKVEQFFMLVRLHLGPGGAKFGNEDIRRFTRACLGVITRHVSTGEMREIRGVLPERLKELIQFTGEIREGRAPAKRAA